MNKQTFEIIDGVYVGPEVWGGALDLHGYKETLTSLGSLTKVGGYLDLKGCTNLTSLGSLKEVGSWVDLRSCISLRSLGTLKEVGSFLWLSGCTNLVSLDPLKEVKGNLYLFGCINLTSLGSPIKVGGFFFLKDYVWSMNTYTSPQDILDKVLYYSSLPLHEALNALHIDEVQRVPLYKNILLKSLQGGGISSL